MMKQWTVKFNDENMMVGSWVVLSLASGGVSGNSFMERVCFSLLWQVQQLSSFWTKNYALIVFLCV